MLKVDKSDIAKVIGDIIAAKLKEFHDKPSQYSQLVRIKSAFEAQLHIRNADLINIDQAVVMLGMVSSSISKDVEIQKSFREIASGILDLYQAELDNSNMLDFVKQYLSGKIEEQRSKFSGNGRV